LLHCESLVHSPHVCETPQKGVAPEHCASLVHWTQVPLGSSQTVPAEHCASAVHGAQVWDARTQIGVVPEHSELTVH
jgi:hypothetical protein